MNIEVSYDVRSKDNNRYIFTETFEISHEELLGLARLKALEHLDSWRHPTCKVDVDSVEIVVK
jgi:hypothetical protein